MDKDMVNQKRMASNRERLVVVTVSAVLLLAGFFFLWHFYFDSWILSLIYTCIVAGGAKAEWDRQFAAPNRNVRPRGHRCRRR